MVMEIPDVFEMCRQERRAALMPFLTSGYPSEKLFTELIRTMIRAGADMIEIGVPFSDPLADGPSIQKSSETALADGINLERTLHLAADAIDGHAAPLILMSYINPILAYGKERLLRKMRRSGFRGIIIPDLIPEEGREMERLCREQAIDMIYLLAPTSDDARRRRIIQHTSGFVYLVSVAGVTGARKELPPSLRAWIRQVKQESTLPVCVGFGISRASQARELSGEADGIIIGSALVEIIERSHRKRQMVRDVDSFISDMRKAL
jgi:tryptophan synthase alpha chain